jgi:hypothetical protein
MSIADALRRDYRVAFLTYLPRREEKALHAGYEIGRTAVIEGLSVLELSRIHHEVFRSALSQTPSDQVDELVEAASEFFLEVIAVHHMTHGSP